MYVAKKKEKEQFESELEELGSIREMQLKESEASGRISGLEKKIQYAEIEKVTSIIIPLQISACVADFELMSCHLLKLQVWS